MYSLEEIELSDGHNEAAISEPRRKSENSIPLAKIIQDVEKTYDPGKKLLNESKKSIPLFQKAPAAPFYSPALKAAQDIKQEKATPEQLLKMIEKNGGLKAGEDKWTGLSYWLKNSDNCIFSFLVPQFETTPHYLCKQLKHCVKTKISVNNP